MDDKIRKFSTKLMEASSLCSCVSVLFILLTHITDIKIFELVLCPMFLGAGAATWVIGFIFRRYFND